MTVSRLVNYVDGNTLTGAQLNAEFDNILNNGPSLVSLPIPAYSAVSGLNGSVSTAGIGSFSANAYQLKSTSVICSLSATSSYSVNTQTAGPIANGRDQVAVFASTQVHFYAITTGGTSTNAAGICSTRPPTIGPTLPAGYTAWAYLTSVIYSTLSSAPSLPSVVRGSRVYPFPASGTVMLVLASGNASVITEVPCGTLIPTVAVDYTVQRSGSGIATAGGLFDGLHLLSADLVGNGPYESARTVLSNAGASGTFLAPLGDMTLPNINSTPAFGYLVTINVGASGRMTGVLTNYSVPNGDVG